MNILALLQSCLLCMSIGVAMLVLLFCMLGTTVLVFFHELAHLLTARTFGAKVAILSIGFGPQVIGFTDRRGTLWQIAALPLGGFIKYDDETGYGTSTSVSSLCEKARIRRSAWRRAATLAAGPISNLFAATLIFAGIFVINGREVFVARVESIEVGSVAAGRDLRPGDALRSIDGMNVDDFATVQSSSSSSKDIEFLVERNGQQFTMAIPWLPACKMADRHCNAIEALGIKQSTETEYVRPTAFEALFEGARDTYFASKQTLAYGRLLISNEPPQVRADEQRRIRNLPHLIADSIAGLSVLIAVLNLLPFMPLDGGMLVLCALEAFHGYRVPKRIQHLASKIGLAFCTILPNAVILRVWLS